MRAYRILIEKVPYYATQLEDRISLILVKENEYPILSSEVLIDKTHELYVDISHAIKTAATVEEPSTHDSVEMEISFTSLGQNLFRKEATYFFNYDVVEAEVLEIVRAVPDGKDGEIQDLIMPIEKIGDFVVIIESFLNDELNVGVEDETLSHENFSKVALKDAKTLEIKCGDGLVRSQDLSKYQARQLLSRLMR